MRKDCHFSQPDASARDFGKHWGNAKRNPSQTRRVGTGTNLPLQNALSEGSSYSREKRRLKSPGVSWCRFAMPCRCDGAKRPIRGAANFAGPGRGCPCRSCHFQESHRQEVHLETVSGNERRGRHLNREEKVQRPLHDLNLSSLLC